ncbi:MAG: hypothetical protein JWO98_5308 [Frankiales bacterium]|nr:hypothetical protein [Frankiales bacterium]
MSRDITAAAAAHKKWAAAQRVETEHMLTEAEWLIRGGEWPPTVAASVGSTPKKLYDLAAKLDRPRVADALRPYANVEHYARWAS